MKVLLTGASGFIGSYLLEELKELEIEVITIGRNNCTQSQNHYTVDLLAGNDISALMQKEQPTHLLHLAWEATPRKYWTSPLNLRWVDASIRLVETFCALGGKKVISAGTCAEYDWDYSYCREISTPLNPSSLYGTAKDATRRLIEAVCNQYQVPCCWGRIFFPMGRGEASSRLVPSLIEVFRGKREPFPINTTAYRDLIHATDLANGFIQLLTSESNGVFNICSNQPTRLHDVVTSLADLIGINPEPVFALARINPHEPKILVGDNSKLKKLGWKITLPMPQALDTILKE